ncbi:unnamed protein product [Anisakis simplex]|uniref:Serine/threonine kinase NLK (inferred by orthology to a C. elegans protein) n=1 Tax=Anisakis simplex TaxID=6269 RepID=A0A0M3J2A0_ANISI|nr:unnamed protein product [Anisakis simplex]
MEALERILSVLLKRMSRSITAATVMPIVQSYLSMIRAILRFLVRHLMAHLKLLTSGSHVSQAILTAAQPFYHSPGVSPQEFQPDRPIGYGAFGVVWSVTDPRSGKRVALKKMPNVFQNLASCKRVFREIRMLSSFKHDNWINERINRL